MIPDLRGCEKHGLTDWASWWSWRDQKNRYYCRACRRESPAYCADKKPRGKIRHYHQTHCVKGHLKTPWTWKMYGGHVRCVTCAKAKSRNG